jgi:hypothetical protein
MRASNAPSNQPCGKAEPVHSPTKLSEPSEMAVEREWPQIQYTHAPSSVTARIMAKKKTKASSLRSTAQFPGSSLIPKVEVDNGSDCGQRDNAEEYKPSLWFLTRIRVEWVWWLEQVLRYRPPQPEVRSLPEVFPEHRVNLLSCNLRRHSLAHQDGRDPFSVVVRKLKAQYGGLRTRWQAYCHYTYGLLSGRKVRGLHLTIEN